MMFSPVFRRGHAPDGRFVFPVERDGRPRFTQVKHSGLYLRPVRRFPPDALPHPHATGGARLPTLPVPRLLLLPLPLLFLLTLDLFGTLALHELDMQRPDFRQKQKFPIACHDSLHLLQLILQLLFFLMALFPVGRVSRFKPRQLSAKGIHFPLQTFLSAVWTRCLTASAFFSSSMREEAFLKHGRVIEKRGFRQRGILHEEPFPPPQPAAHTLQCSFSTLPHAVPMR